MPYFRYKAKDENNQTQEGMIQAASREEAAGVLDEKGLNILSIEEEKINLAERSLKLLNRVKGKDLVIFARQLSVIIAANIPLVEGLKILITQTENQNFKTIVSEITDEVEGGSSLSAALSRYTDVFDDFFINIIRSGETSGKLDETLLYLAEQMEKDYDLKAKIRGAMIYPIFIVSALFVVGILMMVMVIPKLTETLEETGAELPFTTKILIATSDFLQGFWWLLIIMVVGLIAGFTVAVRTETGRLIWDSFKLRVPVFGKLIQEMIIVKFARSLSTLTTGGVPLTTSLEVVSGVVGNVVYRDLIRQTMKEVEDGNPLATVFLQSPEMPMMVAQMLDLGEKTGRLDDILGRIADFYGREVNNKVANLVSLLEPFIFILLGVAVAGLVSAIMLPMYNLALGM